VPYSGSLVHYVEHLFFDDVVMKQTKLINAIIKASQVLEFLASNGESNLSTMSRELKFPKSTTLRLLSTLISVGYIEQNPENYNYNISRKFVEVGLKVMEKYDFVHISRPYMLELAEKTGETVNLGVIDGLEIVCLDQVSSKHSLRNDQPIGSRILAHCTSIGKSMLANLDEEEIDRLFLGKTFELVTPNTLINLKELKKELKLIRSRGYAIDNEEAVQGVRCVGSAIVNHLGKPIAALSIAGPSVRITKKDANKLGPIVKETTKIISKTLGA